MKRSELRKVIKEIMLTEAKKLDLGKEIDTWIKDHQKLYEKFLDKLLLGKSIKARASKASGRSGDWQWYDIMNIKKVKSDGGYFYGEIIVVAKDNEHYTILNDDKVEYL